LNSIELFAELGKLAIPPMEFIKSIPNVIWAAGIAASVTVYGITKNIRHDTEQRRINRELDLKREVYLEAMDSISKSIYRIATISSINVDDKSVQLTEGMELEISGALKVPIVASSETFQKCSELINLMNAKFTNLYFKKVKIYFLDQKFKVETGFLTNEVDKLIKQASLIAEKRRIQMELVAEVAKVVEAVNQKALDVIISIRKELNLPVDIDSILKVGRENTESSRSLVNKSLMDSEKEFNDFVEFIKEMTTKYVSPHLKEAKEEGSGSLEQ
jgi:hypothetical protein